MEKSGRRGAAEEPRQLDLPAGRRQQIVAANHQRDLLRLIVDGDGTLVAPVAVSIAKQHIAGFLEGPLLLRTVPQVVEAFDRRREPGSDAQPRALRQSLVAAGPGIPQLLAGLARRGDFAARAFACVHETSTAEVLERRLIDRAALALTDRSVVGGKAEPVQILDDGPLVLRPAALPIVVLDAQQHAAACPAGDAPHVDGVDDVPEVEEPGRRGRESCDDLGTQRTQLCAGISYG